MNLRYNKLLERYNKRKVTDMIETEIVKVDKLNPDRNIIERAGRIIRNGGLVAFPTETVYGLGGNGLDDSAADKIFAAKGRPQDNPLILHISSMEELFPLIEFVPPNAEKLMKKFWPGPLTLIFKRSKKISDKITGGLSTVAIRMPNHPVASMLIKESAVPIAAPSANTSGRPSPTEAKHVIEDLSGKIDMIIDGGSTEIGVESTVLDISGEIPTILRPGGITWEDLMTVFPRVDYDQSIIRDNENIVPKSPGQKYKHYAPKAEMIVFTGRTEDIVSKINEYKNMYIDQGKNVGIMATSETEEKYSGKVITVGSRNKKSTIAKNLFKALRDFDNIKVDIILAEGVDTEGIGRAIMNRMKKACGGRIERV
jgi:L-threonylcarbamoyladenylate synthase